MGLNRLFAELNRKWFEGRLRPRRVRWASWRAHYTYGRHGICTARAIYIRRGLSPEQTVGTLLHEMCHIGSWSHGPTWIKKMERLRKLGAPINLADLDPHPIRLTHASSYLDDLACELPELSWRKARSILASELGLTGVKLDKALPWARKRWERLQREEAEYQARVARIFSVHSSLITPAKLDQPDLK